jgi:hypothetical protein
LRNEIANVKWLNCVPEKLIENYRKKRLSQDERSPVVHHRTFFVIDNICRCLDFNEGNNQAIDSRIF